MTNTNDNRGTMALTTPGIFRNNLFANTSDFMMVVCVIGILMVMIVPVHPFLLDFLLALNITFAITVVLMGMYTVNPLDFSIFPSVLI